MVVTLRHPKNRRELAAVNCNVVHVKEVNGPADGTDIEWWLMTSLPVESFEDIERVIRSEEHTSELQSQAYLVCRLLLEKKT